MNNMSLHAPVLTFFSSKPISDPSWHSGGAAIL